MKLHLSRVVTPAYQRHKNPNSVTSLGPVEPAAKKKASPKPKRVDLIEGDRVTLRCYLNRAVARSRAVAQRNRPVPALAAD
eukprot:25813-Prymnesium_polylepis.1